MSTLIMAGSLLGLNLGLLWLLIALPLGRRSIVVRRRFPIGCETLWQAIDPMGSSADWYSRVLSSRPEEGRPGIVEQTYDQMDRKGQPVRRQIEVVYDRPGAAGARGFAARVTDDSALDISFWSAFEEKRKVEPDGAGCRLTVVQTDRYRGLAFLIFRWFLLRRELDALANWVRTGEGRARGWIERPPTQFGLALLSILALWPFFGLTASGFFLSATLTIVIVLHELGHMLAYRACGHRSARMIIIPLLGGVAIGGRPYDSLFEVAFCALMGAGTSAFVVAGAMTLYPSVATTRLAEMLLAFVLIGGGFNLSESRASRPLRRRPRAQAGYARPAATRGRQLRRLADASLCRLEGRRPALDSRLRPGRPRADEPLSSPPARCAPAASSTS